MQEVSNHGNIWEGLIDTTDHGITFYIITMLEVLVSNHSEVWKGQRDTTTDHGIPHYNNARGK